MGNKSGNKSGIVLGIVLATIVLVAAVGGTSAQPGCVDNSNPSVVYRCGDTVVTSCTFNGSMTCPVGLAGLNVGADDIVINGNGHTITGTTTASNCEWASESTTCTVSGIYNAGYDNVEIKNLEIEGFCTGVALQGSGANKVRNDTVENCSIHDNGFNTTSSGSDMATHGVHACYIDVGAGGEPAVTIKGNDIYNNEGTGAACGAGGNGVFIYAGSPDAKHEKAVISCNKLHDNAKAGFWTKMMLDQSEITYNEVYENGYGTGITDSQRGGIILRCKKSSENLIAYNHIFDNDVDGIYVGGESNVIRCNTVTGNTDDGIDMGRSDGSFDNELYHNAVCGNGDKDITTFGTASYTIGDNNTCDTCNNYNDVGETCCTWTCDNLVPAYYDFDQDDHYSDVPENCNCGQGACCNPGLFNESGASSHCDYCDCQDTHGDDPNDCDSTIPGDIGTPITSCNFNAGTPGEYYYLPDNLDCNAGEAGVIIGANNVIIDGNGYIITGTTTVADCASCTATAPCTVSGIYNVGFDNVEIKNLEIEGFCTGIALKGTGSNKIRNNTIDNCEIYGNGFSTGEETGTHGIHACLIDGTADEPALTITNNEIYNNEGTGGGCGAGGNGVFIVAGGPDTKHEYCDISYNNLYNNAKAGFWTKAGLDQSSITYNEAWGNGDGAGITDDVRGGIVLKCRASNRNLIAHNDVYDHAAEGYGYGIYVGGSNNTIEYNNVTNNSKHGISMARSDGSYDNVLYENTFCDNGEYDISTFGPDSGTTGDNNTCQTASEYCDTSAGCPPPCVFQCTQTEEPDLIIEDIRPIRWCCCCIKDIKALKGGDDSEEMSVMFIDDPELAKELGDEELRKEVAEVLAKDPKLAKEIAAKLAGDDDDDDDDNKKVAKELLNRDPKKLAELCCYRSNVVRELADLLDTELTPQAQHEMSDQLDMIVGGGCCCGGCCGNSLTAKCCCCGRFIAYKIANNGTGDAGFSLSNLTVNGRVRSVDIVRPLDAGQRRWEVFPCYRMWWWPSWPREVTVCADVTDWVAESDETNNCRTEWFPPYVTPRPTLIPTLRPGPIRALNG